MKLIAIGNGTASRETDKIAGELVRGMPEMGLHKIVVSGWPRRFIPRPNWRRAEFPDLTLSLRGAVSIARRL